MTFILFCSKIKEKNMRRPKTKYPGKSRHIIVPKRPKTGSSRKTKSLKRTKKKEEGEATLENRSVAKEILDLFKRNYRN